MASTDRSAGPFPPGAGWRLLLVYVALFVPFAVTTPYLQKLLALRGFREDEIGLIQGCFEFMAVVAPPLWGYLSDRTHHPRLVLALCICGAVPVFMLFGQVQGLGAAIGAALLLGLFVYDFTRTALQIWIWVVIFAILGAGIVIGIKLAMKSKQIKRVFDRVILKVPLVGDLVTKVAVARFARTLGTLITSGVPILQALKITRETIGNEVVQNAVDAVHESVKEGDTIAAPLDKSKVFPAMVVNMIDVGEETGSLDAMLVKVADIYDAEVENAVEAMLSLLEPMIIIVLGGIIGFIVVALYLPIFTLGDQINNQ